MVFDIGNVLMDFRWKEYMRSLFGENEALIQTINQGIWHNGCWAAMDKGEMDGGVFSFEVKAVKPEPEIYRCLCDKYGLKPEECLFTDDVPANVKGAQACGFQGIVFEGYEKTYPLIMKALR
jgi:putative hydrolase of the HAD superfamily